MRIAALPDRVFRLARLGGGNRLSRILPEDALLARGGNRFDVPGAGVLYAASSARACFLETLAEHRPSPVVAAAVAHEDPSFMAPGEVCADWRERRRLYQLAPTDGAFPFVDLAAPSTRIDLAREVAHELATFDVSSLDLPEVTTKDRRVTRLLAQWIYAQTDVEGAPLYGGIRYISQFAPEEECWAIFDRTPMRIASTSGIKADDSQLRYAAGEYGLTIH